MSVDVSKYPVLKCHLFMVGDTGVIHAVFNEDDRKRYYEIVCDDSAMWMTAQALSSVWEVMMDCKVTSFSVDNLLPITDKDEMEFTAKILDRSLDKKDFLLKVTATRGEDTVMSGMIKVSRTEESMRWR